MSDFDPGEGWREVERDGFAPDVPYLLFAQPGQLNRVWIPEEPVPPLPTEPWTVVLVKWREPRDGATEASLMWDGYTWSAEQVGSFQVNWLRSRITGFEVLTQPSSVLDAAGEAFEAGLKRVRRETAKAVLDRRRELYFEGHEFPDEQIAAEFGVEL